MLGSADNVDLPCSPKTDVVPNAVLDELIMAISSAWTIEEARELLRDKLAELVSAHAKARPTVAWMDPTNGDCVSDQRRVTCPKQNAARYSVALGKNTVS